MAALKFLTLASASAVLMANAIRQTEKQSPLAARETPVNYTVDLGTLADTCLLLKVSALWSKDVFLMANAIRQTEKQSPLAARETPVTYTVVLGEEHVCLDEINAARLENTCLLLKVSALWSKDVCIVCFYTGEKHVCLEEINAAREAAGLEHFKEESAASLTWPPVTLTQKTQHNTAWDPVCKALTTEESADVAKSGNGNDFQAGTYAYMALESDEPDCAAAVKHWKDAVNNFTTIPPAKNEQTQKEIYSKQQNISFVAMYNPQQNAVADCRVVTCTQTTAPNLPAVDTLNADKGKTGHALLCMTTPEALTATAEPFNEEQWKKIKASITGSASAVAPSLLAVAIAALGLLAL
ncbi:SAG family member [Eimeria mitis]|uniref:SAG family member n=1 Tax=Eimeria mitis TaxID=44415 RepID=U6JT15_9EIME|nr:SAG family member [Eimeria mitis]CDJ28559.1 SAG family member [Eimeria mitis]